MLLLNWSATCKITKHESNVIKDEQNHFGGWQSKDFSYPWVGVNFFFAVVVFLGILPISNLHFYLVVQLNEDFALHFSLSVI